MSIKRVAEILSKKKKINLKQARDDIELFISSLIQALSETNKVSFRSLGMFKKVKTSPKTMRLPGLERVIEVPAGIKISFKAVPSVIKKIKGE
ncbi:HU family DNA-binding protein [Lyticum sinuosum]|uniref:HU family DNA-binding protein n=1 Tax=Lyticum sinuosum TaxID=1332059 RepID=A0AAE5AHZ7_9RICK|nr:HU family DNA-binding protein [Lyticum sinuosum]MDZ5761389.1 HU family DNA-binding protein [Lyticum sinuosum]